MLTVTIPGWPACGRGHAAAPQPSVVSIRALGALARRGWAPAPPSFLHGWAVRVGFQPTRARPVLRVGSDRPRGSPALGWPGLPARPGGPPERPDYKEGCGEPRFPTWHAPRGTLAESIQFRQSPPVSVRRSSRMQSSRTLEDGSGPRGPLPGGQGSSLPDYWRGPRGPRLQGEAH